MPYFIEKDTHTFSLMICENRTILKFYFRFLYCVFSKKILNFYVMLTCDIRALVSKLCDSPLCFLLML